MNGENTSLFLCIMIDTKVLEKLNLFLKNCLAVLMKYIYTKGTFNNSMNIHSPKVVQVDGNHSQLTNTSKAKSAHFFTI